MPPSADRFQAPSSPPHSPVRPPRPIVRWLHGLRRGLELLGSQHPGLSARFLESVGAFEMRRSRLASMPDCGDPSWVWHERRPWTPGLCDRLSDMGYASGSFDHLPSTESSLTDIVSYAYWPARVDRYRGSWSGPV
jgi:hypothetical protein